LSLRKRRLFGVKSSGGVMAEKGDRSAFAVNELGPAIAANV
jgi:hypothetical protein